jgi:hypothetical protein
MNASRAAGLAAISAAFFSIPAAADENLFGYVQGAEPTPKVD